MKPTAKDDSQGSDSIDFQPSKRNTLGVELELQIIDPKTADLAPGALQLLKLCEQEGLKGVAAELIQSMIEVKTGVCQNVPEVRDQLWPLLRKLRHLARSLRYELAMGGTHPFTQSASAVVFPSERYERIQDRLAWLTYQRVVFGLHVHVGVPNGDFAMGILNLLVKYLPHLVAVSASSPFWHGEDTGLASCRTALYGTLPHSGIPRYFRDWTEFCHYYRVMRDCRAIQSTKDIYWDIRPCPRFGTIEIRICDTPQTLAQMLGVVALIHSLVISAQRLLQERPHLRRGDVRRHWIAMENKWLATRYGLGAMYIRTPAGKRRLLRHDLAELIEQLRPIADEVGDAPFLNAICPTETFETGADRQRRLFRESGDRKDVVADMAQRWGEEL